MKSFGRFAFTLLSTGFFVLACAPADDGDQGGNKGSGGTIKVTSSGGASVSSGGANGSGGMTSSSGGASSGGAPGSGGTASGSGGATSGSGGTASGSGGTASGSGGSSSSGGMMGSGSGGTSGGMAGRGSGGSTGTAGTTGGGGTSGGPTFAQVATILGTSCGTGMCHQGGTHVDLRNTTGLYGRIVNVKPAGSATMTACKSLTLVVPSMPSTSVISQVVKATLSSCTKARMPDMCSETSTNPRACLTTAQISTIDTWIMNGATM